MAGDVHFYAPISRGTLADLADRLTSDEGVSCETVSPDKIRCQWGQTRFVVVRDDEMTRVQLLSGDWTPIAAMLGKHGVHGGATDDDWTDLALALRAFDTKMSNVLSGADFSWVPPLPTDSPEKHVAFLQDVYDRVRGAADDAQKLSDDGKKKAREAALAVLDKAKKTAKGFKAYLDDKKAQVAESTVENLAAVQKKIDELEDDVETGALYGVGAIGAVWMGWLVLVGIGGYYYFKSKHA